MQIIDSTKSEKQNRKCIPQIYVQNKIVPPYSIWVFLAKLALCDALRRQDISIRVFMLPKY